MYTTYTCILQDLEYNKIIRDYHGHLSGVYSLALHPTLDLLISGGRDSVARVWCVYSYDCECVYDYSV